MKQWYALRFMSFYVLIHARYAWLSQMQWNWLISTFVLANRDEFIPLSMDVANLQSVNVAKLARPK